MPLPSQMTRHVTPRASSTGRGRRSSNLPVYGAMLALLAVLGLGGWWYWRQTHAQQTPAADGVAQANPRTPTPAGFTVKPTPAAPSPAAPTRPAGAPAHQPVTVPLNSSVKPVAPAPAPAPSPAPAAPKPVAAATPPADAIEQAMDAALQDTDRPGEAPAAAIKPIDHPEPTPARPAVAPDAQMQQQLAQGQAKLAAGELVAARALLSRFALDPNTPLSSQDADALRRQLATVSAELVFSRKVHDGDPLATTYTVEQGDYLSVIAPRYYLTYQFIERINNVKATQLWVGKKLKVIRGPFHAVVDKSDFRLDLFLRDETAGPLYVTSFPVGLGENDSTPIGLWRIRAGGKVTNPAWRNPRTSEVFDRDDPNNPIGNYWLGMEGIDDNTRNHEGYGIHGTTEPTSIGRQMSMGCIRMREDDLIRVYELLIERHSTVRIVP